MTNRVALAFVVCSLTAIATVANAQDAAALSSSELAPDDAIALVRGDTPVTRYDAQVLAALVSAAQSSGHPVFDPVRVRNELRRLKAPELCKAGAKCDAKALVSALNVGAAAVFSLWIDNNTLGLLAVEITGKNMRSSVTRSVDVQALGTSVRDTFRAALFDAEHPVLRAVTVYSRPAGARIVIDDDQEGTAPLMALVRTGSHRVRTELRGHVAQDTSITVANESAANYTVTLPLGDGTQSAPKTTLRSASPIRTSVQTNVGLAAPAVAAHGPTSGAWTASSGVSSTSDQPHSKTARYVIAALAAAAGAGLLAYGIVQAGTTGECSRVDPDVPGRCVRRWGPGGTVLAIIGGGALVAGAGVLTLVTAVQPSGDAQASLRFQGKF